MADEGTIRNSLLIYQDELKITRSDSFTVDVVGSKGPVPGAFTCTTMGTDVDFSELTTPALCRFKNLDSDSYVEYGIWDPETATFFPLGELLPGEAYNIRLSRYLEAEYGTAAGTATTTTNRLRFRAPTGTIDVVVEAFEA